MKTKLYWLVLGLIVVLGIIFRWHNLSKVPLPGQSQDEYSNTWVGLSLIEAGMPVGLSGVSGNLNHERIYINPDRIFQQTAAGDPMTIAYPWFDHPPLVGLITGSYAYLKGARVFEDTTAIIIRKPAVMFSAVTIALVGILGMSLFSPAAGLLGALFYAAAPLTTITNRMVQGENFFTPLALLSLFSWWRFTITKSKKWWYLGTALIMAAVLMKLSAVAFVIAGMILLKKNSKQRWPWIGVGVAAVAAFLWFVIYGMALSPGAFWAVLLHNSERAYGIGYQAVYDLLSTVKVTGAKTIPDGWILASFLGIVGLALAKVKNHEWITVPLIAYLVIYLFFGSESFGWYRLPFFPLTFIALGWAAVQLIKEGELLGVFVFFIPLGVSLSKIWETNGWHLSAWRYLPVVILFLGYFIPSKKLRQIILLLIIAGAVGATLIYNWKIDTTIWYSLT